jgi:hypothetical protein
VAESVGKFLGKLSVSGFRLIGVLGLGECISVKVLLSNSKVLELVGISGIGG